MFEVCLYYIAYCKPTPFFTDTVKYVHRPWAYNMVTQCYSAASKVTIEGKEIPYTPLMDSYGSYTMDCWTYDGK